MEATASQEWNPSLGSLALSYRHGSYARRGANASVDNVAVRDVHDPLGPPHETAPRSIAPGAEGC